MDIHNRLNISMDNQPLHRETHKNQTQTNITHTYKIYIHNIIGM